MPFRGPFVKHVKGTAFLPTPTPAPAIVKQKGAEEVIATVYKREQPAK